MRILLVQPFGLSPGPSEFTIQYANHLHALGHAVAVVSARGLITAGPGSGTGWSHYRALMTGPVSRMAGLIRRLPSASKLSQIIEGAVVVLSAMMRARRERFDIVHVVDAEAMSLVIANLLSGRPQNVAFTYRGYEFGETPCGPAAAVYRRLRRLAWRYTAQNIHVDAETHEARESVESVNTMRTGSVRVISHPVWSDGAPAGLTRERAREQLGITYNGPLLLLFGHRPPGQKDVLSVIRALRHYPTTFRLLIAGSEKTPGEDERLRALIREVGWEERVYLKLEFIPAELTPHCFVAADGLILPYRPSYVGASGVLAQAVTYLRPVIASSGGDLGKVVQKCNLGVVYRPGDAEDIARALEEFLSMPAGERSQRLLNLNRLRDERSWPVIAQQHVEAFEEALGTRFSPAAKRDVGSLG